MQSTEKGEQPNIKQKIYNKFQSISPIEEFAVADIKDIRQRLRLSQSMLADILGVHKRTAEAWEAGLKVPNGSARRMLTILKVDANTIRRCGIAEW